MRYLILGAGPAGLAFANALLDLGEDSFLVVEKEDHAGGLCHSVDVDGAPLDIGGGHFLDTRDQEVNDFLFRYMAKEEWNQFDRDSRIDLYGTLIRHPLEGNIWQLDTDRQIQYLKSIAAAGCNTGAARPEGFVDWIYWKLGERIASDYMLPYNRKMFGDDLERLGTYWLEKLPEVSFEETLRSCLERRSYGKEPGHARFYYPKRYGFGELWRRMADTLGERIEYGKHVREMDFEKRAVTTADGSIYRADTIVTTIPWRETEPFCHMPEEIRQTMGELRHTSVRTEYYPENLDTKAHWIYYPAPQIPYHRILVRHNFLPGSRGYWTETNTERDGMAEENGIFSHVNEYAYPLNTVGKPAVMKRLLGWCSERRVYGLGRWGEHQHYNSDVTVRLAMELAKRLNAVTPASETGSVYSPSAAGISG